MVSSTFLSAMLLAFVSHAAAQYGTYQDNSMTGYNPYASGRAKEIVHPKQGEMHLLCATYDSTYSAADNNNCFFACTKWCSNAQTLEAVIKCMSENVGACESPVVTSSGAIKPAELCKVCPNRYVQENRVAPILRAPDSTEAARVCRHYQSCFSCGIRNEGCEKACLEYCPTKHPNMPLEDCMKNYFRLCVPRAIEPSGELQRNYQDETSREAKFENQQGQAADDDEAKVTENSGKSQNEERKNKKHEKRPKRSAKQYGVAPSPLRKTDVGGSDDILDCSKAESLSSEVKTSTCIASCEKCKKAGRSKTECVTALKAEKCNYSRSSPKAFVQTAFVAVAAALLVTMSAT